MVETEKHLLLKERAKQELLKNFNEDEIFFEYAIKIDNKKYVVDAVGINKNSKIAIECGVLQGEGRIIILSQHFDKVIHIPYIEKIVNKISTRLNKKTIYLNRIQCKRLEIIVNLGYYATESELIRMALNIGLDKIEKEIDK